MIRAYKVQKKAADIGFDWDNIDDVIKKIDEEKNELLDAIKRNDRDIMEEYGDLLFSIVNFARF